MKSIAVLSSLALAGLSAAQFQGLPQCAQDCASQFFSGGIGNCGTDAKCICSNQSFLGDIACCLAKPGGCNTNDQSSAVAFASTICAAQGVSVPTAVSCTASQSGGSSSGTSSSSPATNTAATTSGTSSGAQSTGASNTAASGASNPSSSTSKAWAPRNTAVAGGLLGGVLAAAAML